eukprot:gene22211-biopygen14748
MLRGPCGPPRRRPGLKSPAHAGPRALPKGRPYCRALPCAPPLGERRLGEKRKQLEDLERQLAQLQRPQRPPQRRQRAVILRRGWRLLFCGSRSLGSLISHLLSSASSPSGTRMRTAVQ